MATNTKKKDWSLVIWLFGWLLSFMTVLKKLATKLEVPFEAFEHLGTEAGEEALKRVLQFILQEYWVSQSRSRTKPLPPDHYRLFVTYADIPSWDDLEAYWGKNKVSKVFDSRIPIFSHASCVGKTRTPGEKIYYLRNVGRAWRPEEEIAWGLEQRTAAAPNGYRPVIRVEAYEFFRAQPDFGDYTCLGEYIYNDEGRLAAFVDRQDAPRRLSCQYLEADFFSKHCILYIAI